MTYWEKLNMVLNHSLLLKTSPMILPREETRVANNGLNIKMEAKVAGRDKVMAALSEFIKVNSTRKRSEKEIKINKNRNT